MADIESPLILVASSGQESQPPVSRTMHEKMLYIEALRKGFESQGRLCTVANMTRLEQRPQDMPPSGPTLVLGYMMQFRKSFTVDEEGRLMLFGRQVSGAINDRFVLNIVHQFKGQLDPASFKGYNAAYPAGADKARNGSSVGPKQSLFFPLATRSPSHSLLLTLSFSLSPFPPPSLPSPSPLSLSLSFHLV